MSQSRSALGHNDCSYCSNVSGDDNLIAVNYGGVDYTSFVSPQKSMADCGTKKTVSFNKLQGAALTLLSSDTSGTCDKAGISVNCVGWAGSNNVANWQGYGTNGAPNPATDAHMNGGRLCLDSRAPGFSPHVASRESELEPESRAIPRLWQVVALAGSLRRHPPQGVLPCVKGLERPVSCPAFNSSPKGYW